MKEPKGNHPWRVPRTKLGHKILAPEYLYFYNDIDDLPIMSDSVLIDVYSFKDRKIRAEDSYD